MLKSAAVGEGWPGSDVWTVVNFRDAKYFSKCSQKFWSFYLPNFNNSGETALDKALECSTYDIKCIEVVDILTRNGNLLIFIIFLMGEEGN